MLLSLLCNSIDIFLCDLLVPSLFSHDLMLYRVSGESICRQLQVQRTSETRGKLKLKGEQIVFLQQLP